MTYDVCDEVLICLRRIIRAVDVRSKRLSIDCGLTGPQLIILKELCNNQKASTVELSKLVNLSHSTVSSILDRLEKKELVSRNKDNSGDKRKRFIFPTDKAKELIKNAPPLLQEEFIKNFNKLEDWEQTQILCSLQKVGAMMNAKSIDASPILISGDVREVSYSQLKQESFR